MESISAFKSTTTQEGTPITTYARSSLMDLIYQIVEGDSGPALREFLEYRRIFHWGPGPTVSLPTYLFALRDASLNRARSPKYRFDIVDRAYDITLDKFSRLPHSISDATDSSATSAAAAPGGGIDCRNYYRAFLTYYAKRNTEHLSALEREGNAAFLLQKFLLRHFYFSLLESSRQLRPDVHRYTWFVGGRTFCVYMPRSMSGKEKREWLERNIETAEVNGCDGREHIQRIIQDRLWPNYVVDSTLHPVDAACCESSLLPLPWSKMYGVTSGGFAHALAEEKAANIEQLRPSIRILGPDRLKRLILAIFDDLETGGYQAGSLARLFRLSESSLSRFAGTHWTKGDLQGRVPDLWRNMAHVVSRNTDFIEAAQAAGVWEQIAPLTQGRKINVIE